MNYLKKSLCLLATTVGLAVAPTASAQQPTSSLPVIAVAHQQDVAYAERLLHFDVTANVDYEATTSADWLKVSRSANGVYVHVDPNYMPSERSASIVFSNEEKGIRETLDIRQAANNAADNLPEDKRIRPTSQTANNSQAGNGIERTVDNDYSTYFHTSWSGTPFSVSESNPAVLTYNFVNVDVIDYINYIPRQDGSHNGDFRKVEVYTRCVGEEGYTLYRTYNWAGSGLKSIEFPDGLKNPLSIQFRVLAGEGNYASCAEMEFRAKTAEDTEDFNIFADDMYTTLREGVTQADFEKLTNPMAQSLAYQIMHGEYSTDYRVGTYECYNSPQYYSDIWNAPGKYYDQVAGVTGIHVTKGKHAVLVRGIPEGMGAELKVVAWYVGKEGTNFDGGDPHTSTFALKNGLQAFNYTYDWPGLAYICYYSYGDSEKYPPIRVHFINGEVNGYLTADKTNEEMHQMTADAPNTCMDLVGKKVHSIWTSQGLHNYCRASNGSNIGYRQYINLLDTLVTWEQRLLGFEKYNRVPNLRTMAYVNYTYYMFQGSFGVSFHHNTESSVLNCRTMMYNNYDMIWGLSHEWGHQHQMSPYFNWCGMTEVTNNLNSYDNTVHMGYTDYGHGCMPNDGQIIYNGTVSGILQATDQTVYTTLNTSDCNTTRKYAYNNRDNFSWNQNLYDLCTAMQDDKWTNKEKDGPLWFDYTNYGTCRPYIALYQYAVDRMGLKDFGPDLYEALRQTDEENGSQIEKTGAVDKYELLASAQNNNKNGKLAQFRSSYPSSVWTTNRYVTADHCSNWGNSAPFIMNFIRKASRLTGYNLFPYFEKCGMLRQVAIHTYDGNWYLMTKDMYDEFKADMEALGLKTCSDAMVRDILVTAVPRHSRPNIPN